MQIAISVPQDFPTWYFDSAGQSDLNKHPFNVLETILKVFECMKSSK